MNNFNTSDDDNILEDIYLKTVEILPDAVVIVDENGKIIVFNNAAELFFGYHRSELIGENVEKLIPKEFVESHAIDRIYGTAPIKGYGN